MVHSLELIWCSGASHITMANAKVHHCLLSGNVTFLCISKYLFPMARQQIQMYIKYCLKCQLNAVNKSEKCPHELEPIKIPSNVWAHIGQ